MRVDQAFIDHMKYYFVPRKGDTTVGGDVTPAATDTYNLGSVDKRFDTIRARQVIADTFTGSSGTDADTVDGFHASSTPTAGYLLALNGSSEFPLSVIATHTNNPDAHHAAFVGLINFNNTNVDPDANDRIKLDQGAGMLVSSSGNTFTFAVNQGYVFTWTAQHIFDAGLRLNDGDRINFGTASDEYMYRYDADDIGIHGGLRSINPNWSSENEGWHISYDGNADFRRIFADELHVKAFIADIEQALAGGQIISKSVAILERDFYVPTTTSRSPYATYPDEYLHVEDLPGFYGYQVFQSGDYVRLRRIDRSGGGLVVEDIYGSVSGYVNLGNGSQRWTFTRQTGTSGVWINKGAIVIDYGTSGQGYWEVTTIDTQYSPYAQVVTWATNPWTPANRTIRTRMGKLDGLTDPNMTPSGWGLYSDNVFLNGSLVAADGAVIIDSAGLTLSQGTMGANKIKWDFGGNDNQIGIYGWKSGNSVILSLQSFTTTVNESSSVEIIASGTPSESILSLQHDNDTQADRYMRLYINEIDVFYMYETEARFHQNITRKTGGTVDIGTSGVPFTNLYVDTVHATTIEGDAIGGQAWQYEGTPMYIRPNSASGHTQVQIINPDATYQADLFVERNITLGGTVDGVDIALLQTSFSNHTHSHSQITGITANQHHNQVHSITGTDHTVAGSTGDLVGLTNTNTLGIVTPSSNPGATEKVLKTDSTGFLQVAKLGVGYSQVASRGMTVQHVETSASAGEGIYAVEYQRAGNYGYGIQGIAISDTAIELLYLFGVSGQANLGSTGATTLNNAYGVSGNVYTNASYTGTVTTVAAISGQPTLYGGTISQAIALTGNVYNSGATIGSSYGLKINSMLSAGTTAANTYAIETYDGNVVLNQSGHPDADFRVEGGLLTHLLFVDAGADQVGINESTPYYTLDVNGSIRAASGLRLGSGDPTNYVIYVGGDNSLVLNSATGHISTGWGSYFRIDNGSGGDSIKLAGGSAYGYGILSIQPVMISEVDWVSPSAMLTVRRSSTPHIRVAYDATNYADINVSSGGDFTVAPTGNVVFNDAGGNTDFRVETNTDEYAFFVDGSSDLVSVGMLVPEAKLHITWASAPQLRVGYDASNYVDFEVSTGGNLTVSPTGDFVFDPVGKDIVPATGYDLNIGSLNNKYLTLHVAELWADTLVAQETIATIGGRVVVAPTTELTVDLTSVATTIVVKHNLLSSGDRIWLESNFRYEVMAVTSSYTQVSDGYQYTVTRNLDGSGANSWDAGTAVVNTGTVGSGFIELYSLNGFTGRLFDHIYNYNNTGAVFSSNYARSQNWQPFGDGANTEVGDAVYYGLENTTFTSIHHTVTSAASYSSTTLTFEYWNGSTWSTLSKTTSMDGVPIDGWLQAVGSQAAQFSAPGDWAQTTVNGVNAYWVRVRISNFVSFSALPTVMRFTHRGSSSWGPTIVGWTRNSITHNDVSETWAIGNLNGLYGYGKDVTGVGLGKYQSTYLTIDPTNGIRMYLGSTQRVNLASDGSFWFGGATANRLAYTSAGALELYRGTTKVINFPTSGNAQIVGNLDVTSPGKISAGSGGVWLDSAGLGMDYTIGTAASSVNWYSGASVFASIVGKELSGARGMEFVANRYEFFDGTNDQVVITNAGLYVLSDIYTTALTSYSSTVTGCTVGSTTIYYKKVGKLVIVWINISLTKNGSNGAITLSMPFPSNSSVQTTEILRTAAAASFQTGVGILPASSSTLTVYNGAGGAGFSANVGADVEGTFIYNAS